MKPELTLFYDGRCPLCAWEKTALARHDRHGQLGFIDIQTPGFDPQAHEVMRGITMEDLVGKLHGITADGRLITGVETLMAAYRAAGWWWAYLPLRIVPRGCAERGYETFARHRYRISRLFGRVVPEPCGAGACRP
jgi:predicted DCC family thiol-disulfide oxidoreductase YuxK